MGTKITLGEALRHHSYLAVYCASTPAAGVGCRHAGEMSLLHAIALWGENARLDDLPLKCSHCGSRKVDVRIDHPRGRGGEPL